MERHAYRLSASAEFVFACFLFAWDISVHCYLFLVSTRIVSVINSSDIKVEVCGR